MKCRNCGWDNPQGNAKCEKCNAPLSDYMSNERVTQYRNEPAAYSPQATAVGYVQDEFNPQATAMGCPQCGYPIRPTDSECPMCGRQATPQKRAPVIVKEPEQVKPAVKERVGTVIHGANKPKEGGDKERKKLIAFLVTYSLSPNGDFFPLFEGKNVIGRAVSANVCIQNDSAISDRHLSILYRVVDRKFKFKDEQSSNGTFVNGELQDEGELKNLDKITVGTTELLFMEIPNV